MSKVRYLPVPVDDNGFALVDSATEWGGGLITLTTSFQELKFTRDIKSCSITVVSGTLVVRGDFPINRVPLNHSAVVDNGNGTVTIACTGHGFSDSDPVRFYNTSAEGADLIPLPDYPDEYTILAAGDANNLVITADYTALTPITTDFALGYIDPTYIAAQGLPFALVKRIMQGLCQVKASGACTLSVLVTR